MPYDDSNLISLDELDDAIDTDSLDERTLIPEGTYPAILIKIEPFKASTGSRNCKWFCKLDVPQYASEPALIFNTLLPTPSDPKKAWSYGRSMKAVGVSSKVFPTIKDQIIAAVGRPCQVSVFHKTYEGKLYSQIGEILPPAAGAQASAVIAPEGEPF